MKNESQTKAGGVAVEELVLIPREAGETTESAFQRSLAASPTYTSTLGQPLKPLKGKKAPRPNPPKARIVKKKLKRKKK